MPYDVSGNFTRSYSWTADKAANIKIQATRMDGEFDEYATAMNLVFLRNGVVPLTGDLQMGAHKISGLAMGAVGGPALSFASDVTTGIFEPAAGVLAIAVTGVERFRSHSTGSSIPSGQLFGIGTNTPRTQLDVVGIASFKGAFEDVLVSGVGLTGTINLDYANQAVFMFTANAVANWTFNIRGDASNTLNSIMAVNQMLTLAVEVPQGAAPFYCTAITIDGAAPASLKWQGGAPTGGNASGLDIYLIRVVKIGAGSFAVRASLSQEK